MKFVIDISEYDKEWIGNIYGIPQDINTKIAEAIINAEPCQPEPHWIPVEQDLPEKSGEYLVTVKWVTGESDVDVYEYDARHKTWNDGESAGGERAVAWCNLPEPYKGVTE